MDIYSLSRHTAEMASLRDILAVNLRRIRKERGLSQEALADYAGMDRTYVSLIERKGTSLSVDKLEQLADALGTEAYLLLKPQDIPSPEA